jgi:hypothetical protein
VSSHVERGMDIVRDAGSGKISPEQARAELAKMGETPESMISKASGQAEAAQKLKPSGTAPEATKTNVAEPEPVGKTTSTGEPEGAKVKGAATEPTSLKSGRPRRTLKKILRRETSRERGSRPLRPERMR